MPSAARGDAAALTADVAAAASSSEDGVHWLFCGYGERSWNERCETSTPTWAKPCELNISRSFGVLDCRASNVAAVWALSHTCAWPFSTETRSSIGPSCGGLTCSVAPLRLLPAIHETRSASAWENSGVLMPASIFARPSVIVALTVGDD